MITETYTAAPENLQDPRQATESSTANNEVVVGYDDPIVREQVTQGVQASPHNIRRGLSSAAQGFSTEEFRIRQEQAALIRAQREAVEQQTTLNEQRANRESQSEAETQTTAKAKEIVAKIRQAKRLDPNASFSELITRYTANISNEEVIEDVRSQLEVDTDFQSKNIKLAAEVAKILDMKLEGTKGIATIDKMLQRLEEMKDNQRVLEQLVLDKATIANWESQLYERKAQLQELQYLIPKSLMGVTKWAKRIAAIRFIFKPMRLIKELKKINATESKSLAEHSRREALQEGVPDQFAKQLLTEALTRSGVNYDTLSPQQKRALINKVKQQVNTDMLYNPNLEVNPSSNLDNIAYVAGDTTRRVKNRITNRLGVWTSGYIPSNVGMLTPNLSF